MFEIMFVNSAIANLIRENKIPQIEQSIELNQGAGMITRKMSIDNLLAQGIISPETAYEYSFEAGKNDLFDEKPKQGAAPGMQGMPGMPGMPASGNANIPPAFRNNANMGGTAAFLKRR